MTVDTTGSASGGAVRCWNCGQALVAGASTCLYCGLAQNPQMGRFNPRGVASAATVIAEVPEGLRRDRPLRAPTLVDAPPATGTDDATRHEDAATRAAAPVIVDQNAPGLGPEFVGTPAPAGRRVASFSIDMAVMAAVAVATGLLAHSLLLGVVAAVQVLGILWIMQARAGVSLGAWLMELRVSREDAPFSPGAVPALVRGAVTAAGGLILGAGAWVVAASSAWDGSGRQSVADRVAGTVVVSVPRDRRGKVAAPAPALLAAPIVIGEEVTPHAALAAPAATGGPTSGAAAGGRRRIEPVVDAATPAVAGVPDADITLAETAVPVEVTAPSESTEPQAPASATDADDDAGGASTLNPAAPELPPVPSVLPVDDGAAEPPRLRRRSTAPVEGEPADAPGPRRRGLAGADAPSASDAPAQTAHPAQTRGAIRRASAAPGDGGAVVLVLTFDTGQQETVPLPAAVNLGRNPEAFEPGDILVRVRGKDLSLSRTHARLEHRESGVWVTDNGSTNGTDLLDEAGRATPLAAGVRTEVEDGSRVRIGDRVFTISRLVGGMS